MYLCGYATGSESANHDFWNCAGCDQSADSHTFFSRTDESQKAGGHY